VSRFYGEVKGNRGITSRMGSVKSGLWGHIRGWDIGVLVNCIVNEDGKDEIIIWRTGGSNAGTQRVLIAEITEDEIIKPCT